MGGGGQVHRRGVASSAANSRRDFRGRFCDYVKRTNLDLLLIGVILACYHAGVSAGDGGDHGDSHADSHADSHEAGASTHDDSSGHAGYSRGDSYHGEDAQHEDAHEILSEEHRAVYALLFPWLAEIVGVCAYYLLSRYAHFIPHTAFMFCVGAVIGYFVEAGDVHEITFSAETWTRINGHVILLVFLPGLLYLDSFNIDVHLFVQSFPQLLTFAFPMVLGGTALTALVGYYVFPYGWSLDLSLTFGSILAATDPVAVAVLLNELGAPPRLKIHVSGESLLNDGSAVVFYNIFSQRFFYEFAAGFGKSIGWAEGFKLFFKLSLGGAAIGIAFALALLVILYQLNRRLSGEDSVVQVVATITVAYLAFFTSEILAKCSGIITVVFLGVVVKAVGENFYNDSHLSHHFWEILEYLLNTLLFALGGCVWGFIIGGFEPLDWAYLFALFGLVTVIRFFLVFSFYPLTSNIGIGSSWRESVFMAYGGLRGAVGIALALALHAETKHFTHADEVSEEDRLKFTKQTMKVFGMVGGIALLTLVINAPTCGPLLKVLGLITPTSTRKKLVDNYHQHMIQSSLKDLVGLLSQERFQDVDFKTVQQHVPFLREVTFGQVTTAVKMHKDSTPPASYTKPNLKNVVPYLTGDIEGGGRGAQEQIRPTKAARMNRAKSVFNIKNRKDGARKTVYDYEARYDDQQSRVEEERLVFIKILHSSYHKLMHSGEMEPRGFLSHAFFRSLAAAEDKAEVGKPLCDWEALEQTSGSFTMPAEYLLARLSTLHPFKKTDSSKKFDAHFVVVRLRTRQILTYIHAHEMARKVFKSEFSKVGQGSLTEAEKTVLDESKLQTDMAEEALEAISSDDVAIIKSLLLCHILLNRSADYFKKLANQGLMSDKEASSKLEWIEELIQDVLNTSTVDHSEVLSSAVKDERMSQYPGNYFEDSLTEGLLSGSDQS